MQITGDIIKARQVRWRDPATTWGLVPTMGYLHEGHLSLVRRAKAENDLTAVTIYVNPTQFAPNEDLATYPRNMEQDSQALRELGVDLLFTPNDIVMYPSDFQTAVTVDKVARPLEGAARPAHFQGVATIVTKIFNIIQPTRVYFGQKDAQQTVVLRQMVRDLNFNLDMIICPTRRETDGLALSSRNAYLSPAERAAAPLLYSVLSEVKNSFQRGERSANRLRKLMVDRLQAEPLARIAYVSIANWQNLQEVEVIRRTALCSLAVFFGKTRLIDNVLLELPDETT